MAQFPKPYLNSTTKDDSIMEYVPMDKTDIGARSSGLPKDIKGVLPIDHVSNRSTGG